MAKKSPFHARRGASSAGYQPQKLSRNLSPTRSSELALSFDRALAFHRGGRLSEAEEMYRKILKAQPNHWDSLHFLGVIHHQRGEYEEAVHQIDAALKINPKIAAPYRTRGVALQMLKRFDEAVASHDQAISLAPDDASNFYNRGNALQELKRFNDAVASYDQAITLKPDYAGAFYNRGNALLELMRIDEALASYNQAITLKPDHANAFSNRGVALQKLKRFDEAVASYDRAIALATDDASTFYNRGAALQELKRFEEAVASYDRAITLKPGYASTFFNRGNALHALNRFDEALASYDHAITLTPDYAEAFNNRGVTLKDSNRIDEALASYDKAIALKPDYADAFNNRGVALQELKRYDEAMASYARATTLMHDHKFAFSGLADCAIKVCDWTQRDKLFGELRRHVIERKSQISPFLLLGYCDDAALHLSCAKNYVLDRFGATPRCCGSGAIWRNEKIKVAYLSSDFHLRPLSFLMAELFELHDRAQFEVIGVSLGPDDHSDMRSRLVAAFDRFIDVRTTSDQAVARLLNELRIDIAVDLNGHTQGARSRIFAFRPAPIQVSYLGFPGTMGADFIDYIIADAIVLPFDEQPHYTEKIVHLADCYMVNDRKRTISSHTPTRGELGLPVEGLVFCCFNNNWKITSAVFDVWMRLLKAVEGSVLWLFRDNGNAETNLRKEAAARGIDPTRLVFAGRLPLEDHLARHRLADLFLDTLPYNAHTTASDALWSGLPVLTCRGKAFAGRVAASLLNAVGLSELVIHSLEEYEALALRLATDCSLLRGFRHRLEHNRLRFPLFDSDRFCYHIESAYTTMWELWQRGEKPRSFSVAPHMERRDGPSEVGLSQRPPRDTSPTRSFDSAFSRAQVFHQAGHLSEAEEMYRQILGTQPNHFDALHLLGVIHHQRGDHAEAVRHIDAALKINPKLASAYNNRGNVLAELMRFDEALANYDRAIALKPVYVEAFINRGIALDQLKRFEEAAASYDQAILLKPRDASIFYNRGNALKELKRFNEAAASYDQAIALKADYAGAFYNRGNALLGLRRFGEAMASYDQAIALEPNHVHAYLNRGIALGELKRFDEALASYDRAIALKPDCVGAFINRGIALEELKRFEGAVVSYDQAIAHDPGSAEAFNNRGNALAALKRFEEAVASYDHAIALRPDCAETFSNRSNALREFKRFEEALANCDRAITLDPDHTGAWINRGIVLGELKCFDEALESYNQAITLDPNHPGAFYNRSNALSELRQFDEALAACNQAIALKPDYAEAFNNRGIVHAELGRYDEALASYNQAIALKPAYADAFNNRGNALQELKRFDEAFASYNQAILLAPDHKFAFGGLADCAMKLCDWSRWRELSDELRRHVTERKSCLSPFVLLGYTDDAALHLSCAQNYVLDHFNPIPQHLASRAIWRNDKIRVAYLSSDFRRHAVAYLVAELFERHDRSRFEVIGVSFGSNDGSEMRSRLVAAFDRFIDVRMQSDHDVARLIKDLQVDIAVDLNGHTQYGRLGILAFRPAPIQVTYLGFPGTTGTDFIDYIIADAIVLPFDQQPHYTEHIVHLPDCYQVNDRKRMIAPHTLTRKEFALPVDGIVFCCFNNTWKITPAVFDVWMRLLRHVTGSVLWLRGDNQHAEENLRKEAAAREVDPGRLIFAHPLPHHSDHLARHCLADLFLDTLPYNAHTTASDALWAGLPVLTCRGKTCAGRVAASLLTAVGLPELLTDSLQGYEALALRIATDGSLRSGLRERLRKNRLECSLFDTDRFCRHIEAAYTTMWEIWQRGEEPQSFIVPPVLLE
jgi:predicted O-linked N-acetylglucosamine transferase (SPINDLY family)